MNFNRTLAGQYFDAETGLHYNYHRYYDPSIGRYLRPDPLGLNGGINLYSYVQNNPINYIDSRGLEAAPMSGTAFFEPNRPVLRYSHMEVAWTILFADYSKKLTSPEMDISMSQTIVGAGIKFVFESTEGEWVGCPFDEATGVFGINRYLGFSYTPKTGRTSINVGISLGSQVNVTYPIDTVDVTK